MTTTSKILYADDGSNDRFSMNESILSHGVNANMETLRYQRIPIIILSTSENKEKGRPSGHKGAPSYFVKPLQMAGCNTIVRACQSPGIKLDLERLNLTAFV